VADPRVEASALLSVAGIPDCQSSPDHQVMDPAPRTSSAFIQQWFNIKYKICFREIDLDHALLCPSPSRQQQDQKGRAAWRRLLTLQPPAARAAPLPHRQDSAPHTMSFGSLPECLNWNNFSF